MKLRRYQWTGGRAGGRAVGRSGTMKREEDPPIGKIRDESMNRHENQVSRMAAAELSKHKGSATASSTRSMSGRWRSRAADHLSRGVSKARRRALEPLRRWCRA